MELLDVSTVGYIYGFYGFCEICMRDIQLKYIYILNVYLSAEPWSASWPTKAHLQIQTTRNCGHINYIFRSFVKVWHHEATPYLIRREPCLTFCYAQGTQLGPQHVISYLHSEAYAMSQYYTDFPAWNTGTIWSLVNYTAVLSTE